MAKVESGGPSQTLTMQIRGLYTNSNELSQAPDGALKIADNIWISKDSIAESRRGFAFLPYGLPNSADRADAFGEYKDKLILHYNNTGTTNANDSLAYYDNSTGVNTYTGVFAHPDPLLARIKFAQSNKNLYFTTAAGVYKTDLVTTSPKLAGMYQGLDVTASASVNPTGFMANNTQVAYRVVWGIKDANTNVILGAPSQRGIIANSSGGAQDVSLVITIPVGITTSHFYQIYRSNQSASSSTTPDDDMQLVYEANPTAGNITAKSVTVIDVVPDALRGADLYTNDTQQGILQQNNIPPYCLDLALFQGCMFYANTQSAQQLILTILSVGGTSGIQLNDTVTIAGVTYTAKAAETVASNEYKLTTSGSPAQNITDTALSLIRVINRTTSNTSVYAYYISADDGLPGQFQVVARNLGTASFAATVSARGAAWSPTLPTSGTTISSTNTSAPNGLMFSKSGQPEAVPFLNTFYVGSASEPIRRIIAIRNSLFILKDDGVYRCTGVPGNFSIDTIDTTTTIVAPESAVAINNNCYFLATEGVVAANDNGVEVMSRPIENLLVSLQGEALNSFKYYTFGVSYETERQYHLWTVTNSGETYATQCFVYNIFTRTWTRSTRNQKHGLVLTSDNKMYLANPTSNGLSQERKSFTYQDYVDEAYTVTLNAIGGGGATLTLSDASNVVAGDLLYQSLAVSAVVSSVNYATNVCTMATTVSGWALGSITFLKAIPCLLEWLPNASGNSNMLKHFRELTLIFKQNSFTSASVNFYNEISSGIDSVEFSGSAVGLWGLFSFGSVGWGGTLRTKAFRTFVPREKQRCDLLSVQFEVRSAWSTFQLEGYGTHYTQVSERVSR